MNKIKNNILFIFSRNIEFVLDEEAESDERPSNILENSSYEKQEMESSELINNTGNIETSCDESIFFETSICEQMGQNNGIGSPSNKNHSLNAGIVQEYETVEPTKKIEEDISITEIKEDEPQYSTVDYTEQ